MTSNPIRAGVGSCPRCHLGLLYFYPLLNYWGEAFKWFSSFPWPQVGPMGPPCLCSMGMSQVPSLATPTGSLHLPHECIKWHSLFPSTSCSAPRDSSFWTLPIQLLESLRVITSTSPLAMGASVFLTESSSLADSPCPSPRRPWAMLGLCSCQEWTWKRRRPQMLQGPGCPPPRHCLLWGTQQGHS